ncbi:MAG: DNA repair protein RecO [Inquilinus sp.]|nr:DNA repair protein RecO [Inquilinus sp.]
MEWSDDGIVLSTRSHGESGIIVMLLTRDHGRHAGLARGQKLRAQLQPGTGVRARWRARLAEHLGSYAVEPTTSAAALVIDDPLRLAALASACAVVEAAVPERAVVPGVFEGLEALLAALTGRHWDAAYVQWEIGVLGALGFGLDLKRCAASGVNDDLAYVSPRSGRAVSLSAGEPYRDRLLPLPGFLVGRGAAEPAAVLEGLDLTGHFLERNLFGQNHLPVPPARTRYVERYRRAATTSGIFPAP